MKTIDERMEQLNKDKDLEEERKAYNKGYDEGKAGIDNHLNPLTRTTNILFGDKRKNDLDEFYQVGNAKGQKARD